MFEDISFVEFCSESAEEFRNLTVAVKGADEKTLCELEDRVHAKMENMTMYDSMCDSIQEAMQELSIEFEVTQTDTLNFVDVCQSLEKQRRSKFDKG